MKGITIQYQDEPIRNRNRNMLSMQQVNQY